MKTINAIFHHFSFYLAQIKQAFGIYYTRDLLPQYKECIGEYTYGLPQIFKLENDSQIQIGKFCSIANDVKIFLDGEHHSDNISTYPFGYFKEFKTSDRFVTKSKGRVIIGNDVWIGYGVTILSGVNVGDGAVLGARSLITKDVPPYGVVGGVPAKIIKMRFTPPEVKKLLEIKWWNWPHDKIQKNISLLRGNNFNQLNDR